MLVPLSGLFLECTTLYRYVLSLPPYCRRIQPAGSSSSSSSSSSSGPATAVPDHAPASERRLLLDRALAALTPRQRAVVVLRYYDDLTEHAVADLLGVSVGTVKSQKHLALRRLREAAPELAELLREER